MLAVLQQLEVARDAAIEGRADDVTKLRGEVGVDFEHDPDRRYVHSARAVMSRYFTGAALDRRYPQFQPATLESYDQQLRDLYNPADLAGMAYGDRPLLRLIRAMPREPEPSVVYLNPESFRRYVDIMNPPASPSGNDALDAMMYAHNKLYETTGKKPGRLIASPDAVARLMAEPAIANAARIDVDTSPGAGGPVMTIHGIPVYEDPHVKPGTAYLISERP